MKITGGCHCGSISFNAIVDVNKVLICHCNDCQKLSGASFRTIVITDPGGFTLINGEAKEYIKTAESGNKRAQGFCQDCGSNLYATTEAQENRIYGIRVGVVDQRNELKPNKQIWCNASLPWLNELGEIPRFDTMSSSQ
jgi:hypothetical protein